MNSKQAGQTLIEAVVAIALGVVVVVALVGLSARANRNVNASKIAETASKYAEEGQELLRQIRDKGSTTHTVNSLAGCPNPCTWDDLYNSLQFTGVGSMGSAANNNRFRLVTSGFGSCSVTNWCLQYDSNVNSFETLSLAGITINREVFISDSDSVVGVTKCRLTSADNIIGNIVPLQLTSAEVKLAVVKVSWTDPTGGHTITVQSCITRKG